MKDLEKISELIDQKFIAQLKQIVHAARSKAYSSINFAQVEANRTDVELSRARPQYQILLIKQLKKIL